MRRACSGLPKMNPVSLRRVSQRRLTSVLPSPCITPGEMTATALDRGAQGWQRALRGNGDVGIAMVLEIGGLEVGKLAHRFVQPFWKPLSQWALRRAVSASVQSSGAVTDTQGPM